MGTPVAWADFLGNAAGIVMYAVILAMVGSAGLHIFKPNLAPIARKLFVGGCIGFFFCFATLITLFFTHQFQFQYIFRHSSLETIPQFLLAAAWSGQEGSFLLWAVTSAIFGVLTVRKSGLYERWFTVVYAAFLGGLAGILSYESPFLKVPDGIVPPDGQGFVPGLMNYWVVIHPPTIFLGFGCLTALFAWAIAAMLHKNLDEWIKMVRPWAIVGLTLLGVGLCMGGFWAYEMLGWGGFWMWDPVENTSFVPWVLLAAFIHGAFVQLAKNKWQHLNIALAAMPFILFCYGTFLTRSGFLGETSVHSFAQMDRTALWIMVGIGGLAFLTLIGTTIWSARQQPPKPAAAKLETWLNKEFFYGTGMWLLVVLGLFIAIGMSVPFLTGTLLERQQAVVEEKLYHQVVVWPYPLIMLGMAFAPFLTWRGITFKDLFGKLINTLSITIGLVGFALLWLKFAGSEIAVSKWAVLVPGVPADPTQTVNFFGNVNVNTTAWVLILCGITLFALVANLTRAVYQFRKSKTSIGGLLTHVGLVMTMLGLIFSRGFQQTVSLNIHPTVPMEKRVAYGNLIDLVGRTSSYTDRDNKIELKVDDGFKQYSVFPGLYYTPGQGGVPTPTQSPYIKSKLLYDLYFVVGPFTFVGSEPTQLAKGESGRFNNIVIQYNGYRMEGPGAGMAGTKFIADLTITTPDGIVKAEPYIEMTDIPGQLDMPEIAVTDDIAVQLSRIDAATGDGYIIANYRTEMFPIEVYYKPLTILVWWGVGIMFIGGSLAAFSRRYGPKPKDPGNATEPSESGVEEREDAPEQLTQV